MIRFKVRSAPIRMRVADAAVVRAEQLLYKGPYEVTPTGEQQILPTKGLSMQSDVVVKAIPREYGLVTYDQTRTITVS